LFFIDEFALTGIKDKVIVRNLGLTNYEATYAQMRAFNASRDESTPDELWLTEHPPVYTLGLAGKPEHVLNAGVIPLVQTDRGGQVTYHGPGQAVVYVLLDLRRRDYGVKEVVRRIEQAIIDTLLQYGIQSGRQPGMPGVYVNGAKIAALGLRVARHCTYHGLSINIDNDLAPFDGINPCGYPGLKSIRTAELGVTAKMVEIQQAVAVQLEKQLA
jgi:lipoyl(octanoyl) transferase